MENNEIEKNKAYLENEVLKREKWAERYEYKSADVLDFFDLVALKRHYVKKQKYEDAAFWRDQEKKRFPDEFNKYYPSAYKPFKVEVEIPKIDFSWLIKTGRLKRIDDGIYEIKPEKEN